MIVVGIDPGRNGGVAVLSITGSILGLRPLPYDHPEKLAQFFIDNHKAQPDIRLFIEKAQAMPKDSSRAMFTYGTGFGTLLGILIALKVPHQLVPAASWTRVMHEGTPATQEAKRRSLLAAKRLFPGASLLATPRCRVEHDGLVDALLIAEYGRRQLMGTNTNCA